MTDHLKFIVGQLNNPPFNKQFNLISFDSLDPQDLLQILSDVICTIEQKPSVDIRSEAAEETALRIFTSLRIWKYRPPVEADEISIFRQGVVEGDQQAIYPILEWVLGKSEELKQRSYLARFLVRVDVPMEFQGDPDIQELMGQSDALMETFKEVHKESTASKMDGLTTEDVRTDIHSMEQEREQITRRIEKLKRKTDSIPNKDDILKVASVLREETEKAQTMDLQKQEQRNGLMHAEQKIQRLLQLIKETRQELDATRPEDLIQKLEDENKIQKYMVEEKLPKEITEKRKAVQELQKVVSQPAMNKTDLEEINKKIEEVNDAMNKLVEEKNLQADPIEDKIAIFKQQATIVERKKEAAAEKLQEARHDLLVVETDLREKKNQMKDPDGNEIVTSVQFKNYVNKLRSKTNVYKKKRSELQDLRAEIGVLQRTDEILKAQLEQLIKTIESSGGSIVEVTDEEIMNAGKAPTLRPQTAKLDGKSLGELKRIVENMDKKLEDKRLDLNPTLQELRNLREQHQEMNRSFTTKKQQYQAQVAGFESGYSRLEEDVKRLRKDVKESDSTFFHLDMEKVILEGMKERAEEETKAIQIEEGGRNPGDTFRDHLQNVINKAEAEGKKLRDVQSTSQTDQEAAARQMKLWRDFLRIMECKKTLFIQQHPQYNRVGSGTGGESPASRMGSGKSPAPPGSRTNSARPMSRGGQH